MPILIRPVREQLEHDRLIRLLQTKLKRKFDVEVNVGDEQKAAVKVGQTPFYPDLVLSSLGSPKRVLGVIEVETGESINYLEAMAEWANFARLRAAFHLYVPAPHVDLVRRLCSDQHIVVTELWSYLGYGEQTRFALVHKNPAPEPPAVRERASTATATRQTSSRRTSTGKAAVVRTGSPRRERAADAPRRKATPSSARAKRPAGRSAARPAASRAKLHVSGPPRKPAAKRQTVKSSAGMAAKARKRR